MNNEEIIRIGIILKKQLQLTNQTLNHYGFTESRIEGLIKENYLIPISYNKYQISNINRLYQQGIENLLNKEYAIADKYFELCHKIDPQNREVCLQILLKYIKKRKYKKVYEIFDYILKIDLENNQVYNNIFLYLMTFLPECPQKYLDTVKNIDINSMLLPSINNDKDKKKINTLVKKIYNSKYPFAIYLINQIIEEEKTYQVKYQLIKELLLLVSDIEKDFNSKLIYLSESESYDEIIDILENRKKERGLNSREKTALLLTKKIIDILKTKNIKEVTIEKTNNLNEALEGNNFSLAMNIILNNFDNFKGKSIISILLIKINEIIDNINHEKIIENIPHFEPVLDKPQELKSYSFAATSELFDDLRKDGHIPTKKELAEAIKDIDITTDHEIKIAEDFAYFIKEENISLKTAIKRYGILTEQILMIKLIYARDYYIEGNNELADKLIHEVETSFHITKTVSDFIIVVKTYKNKPNIKSYKKTKTKNNKR